MLKPEHHASLGTPAKGSDTNMGTCGVIRYHSFSVSTRDTAPSIGPALPFTKLTRQEFGTAGKMSLWDTQMLHWNAQFKSRLHFPFQLPATVHPGGQQVMAQGAGPLPSVWKT